jgi:hypothetical protein
VSDGIRGLLRQGDVLLVPAEGLPEGALPRRRREGRLVLARGEATGHAHAVEESGCELLSGPGSERLFLHVLAESGVVVRHEEHDPIAVAPGVWEVRRQREYEPRRAFRWVAD